jgi:hypothetical protein
MLQVNLFDWLKMMVGNRHSEEVLDPNLEVKPSTQALNKVLLVALRCVNLDVEKRPKMGQVVHMHEEDEFPLHEVVCPTPPPMPLYLFTRQFIGST